MAPTLAACSDDRDTVFDLLDAWTCVRWGEDNISWVVHYPEEILEPWVRSEAERQRMTPEQAEEFRKSFSDELRLGAATAVLLSVYSNGASPINLAPLGKNIALVDSSGKRIAPIAFEKRLDGPISGLAQGLIFFPLQTDKNFRIVMRGLAPDRETNFAFAGAPGVGSAIATLPVGSASPPPAQREPSGNEVVVTIPTKRPSSPAKPKNPVPPEPEEAESADGGETFEPTVPPVVPVKEEPAEEIAEPEPAPKLLPAQALDEYLRAWIDGDADAMYALLSAESQGKISKELFSRDVMSGGFRNALRSGYKVVWSGDTAKVTVAKKVLFVRTLESRQINFTTENGLARVSW
jgi:hypothetical protein